MGQHKHDAYAKQDSYDWFTNDTKDFKNICWFANFDPQIIRGKFNELISKKVIRYTHIQLKWLRYRWLYKEYRKCNSFQGRKKILMEIKNLHDFKTPKDK